MPRGEGGGAAGPEKWRERGGELSVLDGGKRHKRIAGGGGLRTGQRQSSGGKSGRSNARQRGQDTLHCLGGTCLSSCTKHALQMLCQIEADRTHSQESTRVYHIVGHLVPSNERPFSSVSRSDCIRRTNRHSFVPATGSRPVRRAAERKAFRPDRRWGPKYSLASSGQ